MTDSLESLAWKLWDDAMYEEALPLLEQLYPTETDLQKKIVILDCIAECHGEMNHLDKAIDSYKRILEIDPNDIDTLTNIGIMFQRKGDREGTIQFYQESVDKGNVDKDDLYLLTWLYIRRQFMDKARRVSDIFVKNHPESAVGYEMIGIIEAERRNYGEAAPAYKRAMEFDSENLRLQKAVIVMMVNMYDFEMVKRAVALYEDYENDPDLLYYLAIAEQHTGNIESYIKHLKSAVKIKPDFPAAIQSLKEIQQ